MQKLRSLSIFFPFFNDAGTVKIAIQDAYKYGKKVATHLEVIAIHGGNSSDNTFGEIVKMKKKFPDLITLNKYDNKEGYAVIKYGFQKATKDWVFYTDGDLQYSLIDLEKLVQKQIETNADIVNGFKEDRADVGGRIFFGNLYKVLSRSIFQLPISDLTCDFRLIRKSFIRKILLKTHYSSILLEMVKKLQRNGARFAEVSVRHYERTYGRSNYSVLRLFRERFFGDLQVLFNLFADSNKSNAKRYIDPT